MGVPLVRGYDAGQMALSDTQVGRVGEQLFAAIATLTSDGELEFYRPETDDDHRDLEVGRIGHMGGQAPPADRRGARGPAPPAPARTRQPLKRTVGM